MRGHTNVFVFEQVVILSWIKDKRRSLYSVPRTRERRITTNDLVFERSAGWESLILPGRSANGGIGKGERADRCRGQGEGGERVAAVEILRANSEQRISGTATGEK